MAGGEVFVIDRVVTNPGCARRFVDTYLAEYAPAGRMNQQRALHHSVRPVMRCAARSRESAGTASLRRGECTAATIASTSCAAVAGSVTPACSGGAGLWLIFGANRSTTAGSPVSADADGPRPGVGARSLQLPA